jgi:hypothetical protein
MTSGAFVNSFSRQRILLFLVLSQYSELRRLLLAALHPLFKNNTDKPPEPFRTSQNGAPTSALSILNVRWGDVQIQHIIRHVEALVWDAMFE